MPARRDLACLARRALQARARAGLLGLAVVACLATSATSPARPLPLRARLTARSRVPAVQLAERHPRRVLRALFIGASVTRGFFVADPSDAFPEVVDRLLAGRGVEVVSTVIAQPGARVAQALDWRLPADQDLVVVHLVTNDFWHATPLAAYAAGYGGLLDRIRALSPRARLVCLGDWGRPIAVNRLGLAAEDYDSVVRRSCLARGGIFVPLAPIFAEPGVRGPPDRVTFYGISDAFHPNDAGQRRIAEAILAALGRRTSSGPVPIRAVRR